MYPNLYFAFKDLFGIELTGLKLVNTFGFFVALAFIISAWVLSLEFRRKSKQGLLSYKEEKIIVGKPATIGDLVINFLLGFVFGYKLIGAFIDREALTDTQTYFLSTDGSWLAGILLGLLLAFVKWREKNQQKLNKPEERTVRIWPQDRVGDIVIYAAVFGFLGAKIFHNLENIDELRKDPIGSLISFSGLTFYGGLICATVAIFIYCIKNNLKPIHVADSFAPVMLLAYGLGRIGCQVAGDGDWGILNSAYISNVDGTVALGTMEQFQQTLQTNAQFYIYQFGKLENVPHLAVKGLSFLPDWFFAFTYPHNVISEGINFAGCTGQFCAYLPIPVFPTPFYEIIASLLLFAFVWSIRKKVTTPGVLSGIYLILNGLERFLVEQIRVNTKYDFGFIKPTQAELIAVGLIISGIILIIIQKAKYPKKAVEA